MTKALKKKQLTYTDAQKLEVIAIYVVNGNILKTSRETGIPDSTIHSWIGTDFWESNIAIAREENQELLDGMVSGVIHAGVQAIADRVANGDEVITKDGETRRKAMTGRDLATVTGIMFDKRQIIRHQPTSIKGNDGRLDKLFQVLENAGQFAVPIEGEVISKDS